MAICGGKNGRREMQKPSYSSWLTSWLIFCLRQDAYHNKIQKYLERGLDLVYIFKNSNRKFKAYCQLVCNFKVILENVRYLTVHYLVGYFLTYFYICSRNKDYSFIQRNDLPASIQFYILGNYLTFVVIHCLYTV